MNDQTYIVKKLVGVYESVINICIAVYETGKSILISLGVDETAYAQFLVFLVTFVFLERILFKPYLNAYIERRKRTVDSTDVSGELETKLASLNENYSQDAKEIQVSINEKFKAKKEDAVKDSQKILIEAQQTAAAKLEAANNDIMAAYNNAKSDLDNFLPEIVTDINKKVLE